MVKRNRRKFVESVQERGRNQEKLNGRPAFQKNLATRLPIKGLHNLGNTCFLNSVIQCLSQSPHLHELLAFPLCQKAFLKRPDGSGIASLQIELIPKELPAAVQLSDLASRLRCQHNDTGITALSPQALRELVIQKHPRFRGFGQHDCHEFLRALLDCLRQEELLIWRRGILDKFKYSENSPEEERQLIRTWGRAASFATRVDRLFGGIIVSSLKCDVCQTVRTNFEFFLDLSLPIPDGKSRLGAQGTARDTSRRGATKSKQEIKRERRKKPQKSKRKHDRARKRAQFDELVEDCSSECVPHEDDDANEESAKPVIQCIPDGPSDNDSGNPNHVDRQTPDEGTVAATDDGQSTDADQKELDRGTGVVDTEKPDDPDAPLCEADKGDQNDTFVPLCNGLDSSEQGTAKNSELFAEISQSPSVTRESGSSDGSCADIEDTDGDGNRHLTEAHSFDTHLSQTDGSAEQMNPVNGGGDTVPSFLEEQLKQLDLNEDRQSGDAESVLIQASRLAQIPLQTSSLSHHMVESGRKAGEPVCDLYSCLSLFTAPEHLSGSNSIVCLECNGLTEEVDNGKSDAAAGNAVKTQEPTRTEAVRRDLILQPPPLLTIHLKRFQQIGVHLQKSQKAVAFPVVLDLSPFCSVLYLSPCRSVRYRLYGVVEHLGRMAGGHYVAYVAVQGQDESTCGDCVVGDIGDCRARTKAMLDFVKRFVGPLDSPPKWPMTTHDLVRRWRRCDRNRLSESIEEAQSLVDRNGAMSHDKNCAGSDLDDPDKSDNTVDSRTWFRCSDEHISKVPLATVLDCQAYVLFYERIE